MANFTGIIIDENTNDAERLVALLKQTNEVEVVGTANNFKTGLELLDNLEPNLLFLAVKNNDPNAFKFIEKVKKQPTIIFVTDDNESSNSFVANKLYCLKKPLTILGIQQLMGTLLKTHQQIALKMQGLLGKLKLEG